MKDFLQPVFDKKAYELIFTRLFMCTVLGPVRTFGLRVLMKFWDIGYPVAGKKYSLIGD
jgi:hypothetical protein